MYFFAEASMSLSAITPRSTRVRPHSSRTVGWALIFWYITGWVKPGSSPSLWP